MGAKLARPDRPCMALVGDGAFSANPSVLATAVEQGIAAVWVNRPDRIYDIGQARSAHTIRDLSGLAAVLAAHA